RRDPALEREIALPGAARVDRGLTRRIETVGAEAGDRAPPTAVARGEGVVERPLALAAPHQAVHVVGPQVVFGQTEPEAARVGIALAGEPRGLAVQIDLCRLVESGHVLAEHVLEPAVQPHLAAP